MLFEMQLVNSLNRMQIYNRIRIRPPLNKIYFWLYTNMSQLPPTSEWNNLKIFETQVWIVELNLLKY